MDKMPLHPNGKNENIFLSWKIFLLLAFDAKVSQKLLAAFWAAAIL